MGTVLRDALGAEEVSFLIADYSGDSLIRLGHSERGGEGRRAKRETGDRVSLIGTRHGEALKGQSPEIVADRDGARILAPVTNRGEAIGLLELRLPRRPGPPPDPPPRGPPGRRGAAPPPPPCRGARATPPPAGPRRPPPACGRG